MKLSRTIGWSDAAVKDDDVALAQQCAVGDESACYELVDAHNQMVYALGFQLLGNHDEALDLIAGSVSQGLPDRWSF